MYPVGSKYSNLAWVLLDAFPKAAEEEQPEEFDEHIDSGFQEPSNEDLIDYINSFPLKDGFEPITNAYVLPISI
jgi:hypothetical protein